MCMGNTFFMGVPVSTVYTVFPHIRPAGINISYSPQMQVLLESTSEMKIA